MPKEPITTKEMKAAEKIIQYGMIEGEHHKQWLLDQVLRILLGNSYDKIITNYNLHPDNFDNWDTGTAP